MGASRYARDYTGETSRSDWCGTYRALATVPTREAVRERPLILHIPGAVNSRFPVAVCPHRPTII